MSVTLSPKNSVLLKYFHLIGEMVLEILTILK